VMWRGSILFYVWALSHPVAELKSGVIDEAYQNGATTLHRRVVSIAPVAKRG